MIKHEVADYSLGNPSGKPLSSHLSERYLQRAREYKARIDTVKGQTRDLRARLQSLSTTHPEQPRLVYRGIMQIVKRVPGQSLRDKVFANLFPVEATTYQYEASKAEQAKLTLFWDQESRSRWEVRREIEERERKAEGNISTVAPSQTAIVCYNEAYSEKIKVKTRGVAAQEDEVCEANATEEAPHLILARAYKFSRQGNYLMGIEPVESLDEYIQKIADSLYKNDSRMYDDCKAMIESLLTKPNDKTGIVKLAASIYRVMEGKKRQLYRMNPGKREGLTLRYPERTTDLRVVFFRHRDKQTGQELLLLDGPGIMNHTYYENAYMLSSRWKKFF